MCSSMTRRLITVACILRRTVLWAAVLLGPSALALAQSVNDGYDPNPNDMVHASALEPNGKLLVGGRFASIGGGSSPNYALLNADGSIATPALPAASGQIKVVLRLSNGKRLLAGDFMNIGGVPRDFIARLNADGTLDQTFNPGVSGIIYTFAELPDGKVFVGGQFTAIAGQARANLARLNVDGSLDTGFDAGIDGTVRAVSLQPDGSLWVGGNFTVAGGQSRQNLARLSANGSALGSANPGVGPGGVTVLVRQADGKVVAGGAFTAVGAQTRNRLARFDVDGTLDTGFNPNADDQINAMALQSDGKLLVGGLFLNVGGQTRQRFARLNLDGSVDTGYVPASIGSTTAVLTTIAPQSDGKVVIGGFFSTVGGQARNHIARLNTDGSLDRTANPAPQGSVQAVAVQEDGKILIGGAFTTLLGGTVRNRIARINVDGTIDSGFNPNADGTVYHMTVLSDGKIIIVGEFTSVGGNAKPRIARLNSNGSVDTGFNVTTDGPIYTTAEEGPELLIGGNFQTVNGSSRGNIARLLSNGNTQAIFNSGANNFVAAIAVQPDGRILVGGNFTLMGGQSRNYIARLLDRNLSASSETDLSFNPNGSDDVTSIVTQPDGKILLGGLFTSMGGTPRNRIARINPNGSLDTGFDPNANGVVTSVALQADGRILVAGFFTAIGGGSRSRIARLNADGTLDSSFVELNPDNNVLAMATQTDGKVWLGGLFTAIGGQVRERLARLSTREAAVRTFDVVRSNPASTPDTILWSSLGAGPEVAEQPLLVYTTDGSANYLSLGRMYRDGTSWRTDSSTMQNLPLARNILLRVLAKVGTNNGAGRIQAVQQIYLAPPEQIFANSFEGSAPNPDIVVFNNVNFGFPATQTGGSIQWSTGLSCACDTAPYDFNAWLGGTGKLQFFWPGSNANRGGVAVGGVYAVLAPGAVIGPASTFITTAGTPEAASWAAGVTGYLGFRFVHPTTSLVNYGYARITSSGPNGHPAMLLSYAYDRTGAAITVPAP